MLILIEYNKKIFIYLKYHAKVLITRKICEKTPRIESWTIQKQI